MGLRRIDYYPGPEALALFDDRQRQERPGSHAGTNSAVLDAIMEEWAELTGIKKRADIQPMSSGRRPELIDANARANDSGGMPAWLLRAENKAEQRGQCGARTKAGHPCRGKSEPGKRRCKWHGGCSTGPKTAEGKARAMANLRQFRATGSTA